MKGKRYTNEEIIGILKDHETGAKHSAVQKLALVLRGYIRVPAVS